MSMLKAHLEKYGIYHFEDEGYWPWGGEILGDRRAMQINKLRRPLQRGNPKKSDLFAFYEFISNSEVASVVHSMKADAIRATGDYVSANLTGSRVLDVGCNIGYLTTWFAVARPETQVTGIDFSIGSITTAKVYAKQLGVENVTFKAVDANQFTPEIPFDSIVDTQGLIGGKSTVKEIERILSWLSPNGRLICVPAIGTLDSLSSFLDVIASANAVVGTFDKVQFNDLGEPGIYPTIIIHRSDEESGLSRKDVLDAFKAIVDEYLASAVTFEENQ